MRARDEGGKIGERPVTVTVTNVNERPTITGAAEASIEEEGTLFVDAYTASDPESATIAWQPLAGSDADKFEFKHVEWQARVQGGTGLRGCRPWWRQ